MHGSSFVIKKLLYYIKKSNLPVSGMYLKPNRCYQMGLVFLSWCETLGQNVQMKLSVYGSTGNHTIRDFPTQMGHQLAGLG